MAHSSPKCNRREDSTPVGLKVKGARGKEQLCGALPVQRFSGPGVELESDGIQVLLGMHAQV